MTTAWSPDGLWPSATVAVLAPGPSLTAALAAEYRQHKTIAANRAVKVAPWADMFVAIDPWPEFWTGMESFEGLKVCGVECELEALYPGISYERVRLDDGSAVDLRNNGLLAIRLAARAGAAKIILVGFDPESYDAMEAVNATGFRGLTEGLDQIVAELRAQGVEVERAAPAPLPSVEPTL